MLFEQHCAYLQAIHVYVAVVSEQTYSIQGIIDKCVYTEQLQLQRQRMAAAYAKDLMRLGRFSMRRLKLASSSYGHRCADFCQK